MSPTRPLKRHQRVKVGLLLTHTTFEPFDRFSKMRYHWIPWIKTNSTHPMASISGYIDFPPFPVLSKTFERPPLLQFLSNLLQHHQRRSSDKASQHLSNRILILTTVCPVQPLNFSRKAIKQEVKSYLSKSFRYQHQTWYARGRHYNMSPCAKATSYLQK